MNEWKTDEFGNRRWHHDGWTIDHWSSGAVDVEGPEGESIDLDGDVVSLVHEAPYEGCVRVSVPVLVLLESIRLIQVNENRPPGGEVVQMNPPGRAVRDLTLPCATCGRAVPVPAGMCMPESVWCSECGRKAVERTESGR